MLNHRVARMESRSFRAASIRCAAYPPPPGSAPGYQLAHHCTAIGMTNTIAAVRQSEKSGSSERFREISGCVTSPARPPTSGCASASSARATPGPTC